MIVSCLKQDLNKTLLNIGFIGAALLTAVLCFTAPTYHDLTTDRSYSVFESFFSFKREFIESDTQFASISVFQNGLGGYISMFLPIIVAFPFMVSFCAERNSGLKNILSPFYPGYDIKVESLSILGDNVEFTCSLSKDNISFQYAPSEYMSYDNNNMTYWLFSSVSGIYGINGFTIICFAIFFTNIEKCVMI